MTARIAPATPPFPAGVQAVLDRLPRDWMPPFMLFTVLARNPRVFERFTRGAMIDLERGTVSLRQREVLLCRVLARAGCEYEWGLRVHYFAEGAGLSPQHLHALVHGEAGDPVWEPMDRLMIRLADELHDDCTAGEPLWCDLRAALSEEAIIELLYLAGFYRTVAGIANALQFPPEPEIGRRFPARGEGGR